TNKLAETVVGVREVAKNIGRARVRLDEPKTVMIVCKLNDQDLIRLARDMTTWLIDDVRAADGSDISVYVDAQIRDHPLFNYTALAAKSDRYATQIFFWTPEFCAYSPELIDFVITLGGDGTVLYTSWLFQNIVPPVIPFHLGSLGFLTVFDFSRYKSLLRQVFERGARVNLRMRFTCTVFQARDAKGQAFQVLNELVVDRGPSAYMSQLELFGDERHLTTVQADGLVVSTPTGSTAYSLSAGGSIVHPEVQATLVTPICPHTLSFRPMLLPDSMELKVCVPPTSRNTAWASFDGRHRIELKQGDFVSITASKFPFPTICHHDQSSDWFHSLARCLHWNERQRQKAF
ncbi:ATP-NAD kinase-like domain-containing protein, partial [Catenaria anguillulae PL171]